MKILTNQLLIIGLLTIGSCTTQSEKGHEVIPPTFKMTTEIPEGILTPDQVETSIGILEYFDGVPSKTTSENVYDYLDRMRGVDAFLKGMPGASVRGLIMGIIEAGADEVNKVLFTEREWT